ncbi:hypothetical protein [Rubinisphaera brasiliensis]|nr:hypothetical protein [Rubinisphaera brasiliensis]
MQTVSESQIRRNAATQKRLTAIGRDKPFGVSCSETDYSTG